MSHNRVCTRLLRATALAAALVAFGALADPGRAATPPPTLSLTVAPQPVVTSGGRALAILKLAYSATATPTNLSNAFVEAYIPQGSFDGSFSSAACALDRQGVPLPGETGPIVDVVRCPVGNIRRGDSVRVQVAVRAPASSSLQIFGKGFWNEAGTDKNPQAPNDSTPAVGFASDSTTVVSTTNANAIGDCTGGGGTLSTSAVFGPGSRQSTVLNFSANDQGLTCTPVGVLDDVTEPGVFCGRRLCSFSTIALPSLRDPATASITFDGSLFPPPGPAPNPETFRLLELETMTSVPLCPLMTPLGACETGAEKFGSRGLRVFLSLTPTGIDPRYGG
jgi:hypothetical protein